jgi:hypothetical protein
VEEWQHKRGTPEGGQRLTTAFLDGTHPVVDVYELKASARKGQDRGRAGAAGHCRAGEGAGAAAGAAAQSICWLEHGAA